jgi:cytochrome P450
MSAFFLLMTLNPDAQARAQQEIDSVVGGDRLPNIDDRSKLPYVDALIKEVLRRAPVATLGTLTIWKTVCVSFVTGIPHAALEEDVYQDLLIPKGSTIIANIWSVARALLFDTFSTNGYQCLVQGPSP